MDSPSASLLEGSAAFVNAVAASVAALDAIDFLAASESIDVGTAQRRWLRNRWAELDSLSPLEDELPWRQVAPGAESERLQLVDPLKIVFVSNVGLWGRLDSGEEPFWHVLNALRDARSSDSWAVVFREIFETDPIDLGAIPGDRGSIFERIGSGAHRIMISRALGLPLVPALVSEPFMPGPEHPVSFSRAVPTFDEVADAYFAQLFVDGRISSISSHDPAMIRITPASDAQYLWEYDPPAASALMESAYRRAFS